ncbi:MAG: hypothetical protein ACOY90_23045 [Candidatus Zhuqueibacterota bacterium]
MVERRTDLTLRKEGDESPLKQATASFIREIARLEGRIINACAATDEMATQDIANILVMLERLDIHYCQMLQLQLAMHERN